MTLDLHLHNSPQCSFSLRPLKALNIFPSELENLALKPEVSSQVAPSAVLTRELTAAAAVTSVRRQRYTSHTLDRCSRRHRRTTPPLSAPTLPPALPILFFLTTRLSHAASHAVNQLGSKQRTSPLVLNSSPSSPSTSSPPPH